jgi:hypothetical protein
VTRTRPITILTFAVLGAAAAWLLEIALIATGQTIVMPPVTFAIVLGLVGIVVLALAIPVRRAVRSREHSRIDPFYATRVVVLAKSSSIAGSLLSGAGLSILAFLLTRSVVPGIGSILMAVATAGGALILLVGGLVAEFMCTIPPEDSEKQPKAPTKPQVS